MNKKSIIRFSAHVSLVLLVATPVLGAIQISGDPVGGGQGLVAGTLVEVLPDSSQVVFNAEFDAPGLRKLYRASTSASGTQVQINSEPVAGGDVFTFQVSPDGTTVVYTADLVTDTVDELYSASTTMAGTEVKLSDPPAFNSVVSSFKFVPNSNRVLYRADLHTDNEFELYSAEIGMSGTQVRLTNDPVLSGDAIDFQATPNGGRAIILGDLDTNNVFELYSAPINTPGGQTKISSAAVDTNLNIPFVGDFLITSNSARAIYRGAADGQVYSAPTDGTGVAIKLSDSPASGIADSIRLAPDGSRVTYAGPLLTAGVRELFSANTTVAGSQVKLNDTPVAGASGVFFNHAITPNSSRVVFSGDIPVAGQRDIFSAPIGSAGGQLQLNTNTAGGNASIIGVTSDGSRVVYGGNMNSLDRFEFYSASTTAAGTQLTLSNNPLGDLGLFGFFNSMLTPDGSHLVYSTSWTTVDVFDVYSASVTAEGTQVNLSNLSAGQSLTGFQISPDGNFVVYGVVNADFSFNGLFAADVLGQNPPVKLNDPLVAGAGGAGVALITPDSRTVIYIADQDVVGESKLFAATLPGPPMGIPGDYNNDGKVNAADYVLWRKSPASFGGDPAGYNTWRANFGQPSGDGSGSALGPSSHAVPEPSSFVTIVELCVLTMFAVGRRKKSNTRMKSGDHSSTSSNDRLRPQR